MTTSIPLVIGVFQHERDAKAALQALHDAGFDKDQIGLALREGGAVTTNLLNDLVKLGVPQDRAGYYDNEFKAGRPILSVRADGREQEAASILQNYGAYDYDNRGAYAQNVADTTATSAGVADTAYATGQQYAEGERRAMPLREEVLNVDKQRVQSGEARLHKEVVEEQRSVDVPLTHEEVVVEHHPIAGGRVSDTPVGQDEVIRVPVSEEQVNVTKTPVETGEVSIGKRAVQENQRVSDTVRREEAHLEKEGEPRLRARDAGDIPVNDDLTNQ